MNSMLQYHSHFHRHLDLGTVNETARVKLNGHYLVIEE